MDTSFFGGVSASPDFFVALISIILINLALAGDNSVVIAMAVRSLPRERRLQGLILGAAAAVLLRVMFTFFASKMLLTPLVKFVGGWLILWIAVKLMVDDQGGGDLKSRATTVWQAVWVILVADLTMSLDNILAVAGASHGNMFLLLFGLGLSIPLVVFTSALLSKLMDLYPLILWLGAAILGKVGGEMIVTDTLALRFVFEPLGLCELSKGMLHANHYVVHAAEVASVAGVVFLSLWLRSRKRSRARAAEPQQTPHV